MGTIRKIGLGGGCHWCTEAVFQSLRGVSEVAQGFVASEGDASTFSEAIVVAFDPDEIPLEVLVRIHLLTHESTVVHSLRTKYRSAIYTMEPGDRQELEDMWEGLQAEFGDKLVTQILPFREFTPSAERFHNYYYADREKPFCKKHIDPKLKRLQEKFAKYVVSGKGKS